VGDNEDKTWLTRAGHSTRTAGKTYLLLVDEVLALCPSPPALAVRHTFPLPVWMLAKVRAHMLEGGGVHRRLRQSTVVRHSVSDTAAILRQLEADDIRPPVARQLSVIQETKLAQ